MTMEKTTTTLDEAVAQALREKMAGRQVSRAELARRAELHPGTVERYVAGTRPIPASRLIIFADAIGIETGELVKSAKEILMAGQQHHGAKVEGDDNAEDLSGS